MPLHRPVLLNYALSNVLYEELTLEDSDAIKICRAMADELIKDVSKFSFMNSVVCANGAWYGFQAAMTPVLGPFIIEITTENSVSSRESWHLQVEMALDTLLRMQQWSLSALHFCDLLSRFLGASESHFHRSNECSHNYGGMMEDEVSIHTETEVRFTGYDHVVNGNSAARDIFWDLLSHTELSVPLELRHFGLEMLFRPCLDWKIKNGGNVLLIPVVLA
jgi:hypothetical protein